MRLQTQPQQTLLQRDVPHAEVTALPGCGHFLQEEEPALVGGLLRQFLSEVSH